jgi:hypothetical protein
MQKGFNPLIMGPGGFGERKKNRGRKSRNTVPLKVIKKEKSEKKVN